LKLTGEIVEKFEIDGIEPKRREGKERRRGVFRDTF